MKNYILESLRHRVEGSIVGEKLNIQCFNDTLMPMVESLVASGKNFDFENLNEDTKRKFSKEILGLLAYSKVGDVETWEYDMQLGEKSSPLTPDFLINNDTILEVYSPDAKLPKSLRTKINLKKKKTGYYSTGFMPESMFENPHISQELQKKTAKYSALTAKYNVVILAHTLENAWTEDVESQIANVEPRGCKIVHIHGV